MNKAFVSMAPYWWKLPPEPVGVDYRDRGYLALRRVTLHAVAHDAGQQYGAITVGARKTMVGIEAEWDEES